MQTEPQPVSSLRERLLEQPPLMWVSLAFLGGIVLGSVVALPAWGWALIAGIFLGLSLSARRLRLSPFLLFLGAVLVMGALRYQFTIPEFNAYHIAFYNDRDYDLLVTGTVSAPPDYRDTYTNLRLTVTAVDTGDTELPIQDSLLLARVPSNVTYAYGDVIRLRGKVKTPPENEDFSYRDYLAAQGIHSYMTNAEVTVLPEKRGNPVIAALYAFKQRSLENIYRLFPDPESSLLAGILLGVDTGLTDRLQQAFKNTGTAHIIAISGFNISIIAGIFFAFFSKFLGDRRGAYAAITGIVLYTFLVGAEAAVVRAAVMGSLALLARQVGRRQVALNTLLAVAALMCIWNPLYVWDVGFQLSFFATLGLILYATPFSAFAGRIITRYFPTSTAEKAAGLFSEFVLLTLAAQLTTIPIMAYHFQRISLVSFIANPFILPAQPAVMVLGGLAVLLSHVWLFAGQLAAWVTYPFVLYTIRMVELFDKVPHGTLFLGEVSLWFTLLFYAVLFAVTFGWSGFKEQMRSLGQKAGSVGVGSVLVILIVGLFLIWRAAASLPDGRLHITFLDVGSANAVLIQTPAGQRVLVNGGESVTVLADELGRRLPVFNRKLDWLIVGSTGEEQVAALPRVLERYPADAVLWSGNAQASFSSLVLKEFLTARAVQVKNAEVGDVLDLGNEATLTVLTSGPRGAVFLIEYQNFRALLPVGMSFEALDELRNGAAVGPVSLLLLADAGYAASNPPEWIAALNPELVVLSVAAADENGMPDGEVLEALKGFMLLRTDQNGWIDLSTDGTQLWVNVEKQTAVVP